MEIGEINHDMRWKIYWNLELRDFLGEIYATSCCENRQTHISASFFLIDEHRVIIEFKALVDSTDQWIELPAVSWFKIINIECSC
jgi:hypothetical protein